MKATLLTGCSDHTLFPLTMEKPLLMLEIGPAPLIQHQIDALFDKGVTELNIYSKFRGQQIADYCAKLTGLNINVFNVPMDFTFMQALAATHLEKNELVIALYGDCLCDYDLTLEGLLATHLANSLCEATILASFAHYGANRSIGYNPDVPTNLVTKYPAEGSLLKSCGIGLFSATAVETAKSAADLQDFSNKLIERNALYYCRTALLTTSINSVDSLLKSIRLFRYISPTATIEENNVRVGKNVVIGDRAHISQNCVLENCIIMSDAWVSEGCVIRDSIAAEGCTLAKSVQLTNNTICGKQSQVYDRVVLNHMLVPALQAIEVVTPAAVESGGPDSYFPRQPPSPPKNVRNAVLDARQDPSSNV